MSEADQRRIRRKLRKLRRDPRAFLRDANLPVVGRVFQAVGSNIRSRDFAEARKLGEVVWTGGRLRVTRVDKRVAEPDLATAVFVPRSRRPFRDRDFVGDLIAQDFVGFRDRYLFVAEYDLGGCFTHAGDMEQLLKGAKNWSALVEKMRNVVFLDPADILPYLVRATSRDSRLVVVLTEDCKSLDLANDMAHQIDVAITIEGVRFEPARPPRRHIRLASRDQIVPALKKLIIDHKNKEKSSLVPVYGEPSYMEDIDELNALPIDGVIVLREPLAQPQGTSFRHLIEQLAPLVQAVLLKEERLHQYRDLCDDGELTELLLTSLEDGCRYEIRS